MKRSAIPPFGENKQGGEERRPPLQLSSPRAPSPAPGSRTDRQSPFGIARVRLPRLSVPGLRQSPPRPLRPNTGRPRPRTPRRSTTRTSTLPAADPPLRRRECFHRRRRPSRPTQCLRHATAPDPIPALFPRPGQGNARTAARIPRARPAPQLARHRYSTNVAFNPLRPLVTIPRFHMAGNTLCKAEQPALVRAQLPLHDSCKPRGIFSLGEMSAPPTEQVLKDFLQRHVAFELHPGF